MQKKALHLEEEEKSPQIFQSPQTLQKSPLTEKLDKKIFKDKEDDQKSFKTIGDYTIDFGRLLGSGKYGKVYPAFHKSEYDKDKRYACKVIQLKSSEKNAEQLTGD